MLPPGECNNTIPQPLPDYSDIFTKNSCNRFFFYVTLLTDICGYITQLPSYKHRYTHRQPKIVPRWLSLNQRINNCNNNNNNNNKYLCKFCKCRKLFVDIHWVTQSLWLVGRVSVSRCSWPGQWYWRTQRSVENDAWQQSADGSLHQVEQAPRWTWLGCSDTSARCWWWLVATAACLRSLCPNHNTSLWVTIFIIYSTMSNEHVTTNTVMTHDKTYDLHVINLQSLNYFDMHFTTLVVSIHRTWYNGSDNAMTAAVTFSTLHSKWETLKQSILAVSSCWMYKPQHTGWLDNIDQT